MIIEIPDELIHPSQREAITSSKPVLVALVSFTDNGTPCVVLHVPATTDHRVLGLAIGLVCNSVDGMADRVTSALDVPDRIKFQMMRELGYSEKAMGERFSRITTTPVETKQDPSL